MVTDTLFWCGSMMFCFVLGSIATLAGSYMNRRAYTDEPLFGQIVIEPEEEEEEVIEETDEEMYKREEQEFSDLRGQL